MKRISACASIAGGIVLILIAAWVSWKSNGLINALSNSGFREATDNGGSYLGLLVFLGAACLGGLVIKLGFDDLRKEMPAGEVKPLNSVNILLTIICIIIFGGYFIWFIQSKEKAQNECMDKCNKAHAPADCSSSCDNLSK